MEGSRIMRRQPRVAPLCASLAMALGLGPVASGTATAATVTNCNSSGAGSLRSAIAATAEGGTVTFAPGFPACTITLLTSAIPIAVNNLTIQGPAGNTVKVNGAQNYRIFNHAGTGTLTLSHLYLENGKYSGTNANGGCIVSAGAVSVDASTLTGCMAYANGSSGKARGGAIHAAKGVTLTNSSVTDNVAVGFGGAFGGGIDALSLTMQFSTVSGNYATFPNGKLPGDGGVFNGGGVYVGTGATNITNSTIADNTANGAQNDHIGTTASGGGIFGKGSIYVGASAVYGCRSAAHDKSQGGGIFANAALTVSQSRIAGNYAQGTDGAYGGGLRAGSLVANYATIHDNLVGAGPYGFSGAFQGGGIFVYKGSTQIGHSTIDANTTVGAGGGIFTIASNVTLNDSTVSGNRGFGNGSAPAGSGGLQMAGTEATLHISNSTIAFNVGSGGSNDYLGGGVRAFGTAVIESSIIANNAMGPDPSDLSCACGTNAVKKISGANDLIMTIDPGAVLAPPGMVVATADPHLVPLGDHGGATRSHALLATSAAAGLGNNLANFTTDQRGIGFARVTAGFVDIGAYQRQPNDDELFFDGYE